MKNFWNKLLVEDWVVVMLSIPLLILCAFGSCLPTISIPTNMLEAGAWGKIAMLFVIALITLFAGNKLLSRPMKGMLGSFIVVFAIAALAMVIGSNKFIKNDLGLEPVFFSVIFGLLIRNAYHVPEWMKPAIQGEFYIKIGVVCLGATIMIGDVMKSGVAGLVQACIIVTIVWLFAYNIARRIFKVERSTAMTMSSGLTICGASAAIATAGVAGADKKSLSYIVSVVLIIAVPMIYLMPWLANMIVPLLTDNPEVQQEIMGAWIGGTVDTTSGVATRIEAVECSGWSKTILRCLVGILQQSALGKHLVAIAGLCNIEVADNDYSLALAVLLNPIQNQLSTLNLSNLSTVVEVCRDEVEASLIALALQVCPSADTTAHAVPTLRYLIRSLRQPESTAIEQLKLLLAIEYRAILTLCCTVITSYSYIVIVRQHLHHIQKLLVLHLLRAEDIESLKVDQSANILLTIIPTVKLSIVALLWSCLTRTQRAAGTNIERAYIKLLSHCSEGEHRHHRTKK